jgi:hypothetical protein
MIVMGENTDFCLLLKNQEVVENKGKSLDKLVKCSEKEEDKVIKKLKTLLLFYNSHSETPLVFEKNEKIKKKTFTFC